MHIYELDTPSLLLDLDVLERNLTRMSKYCAKTGVALRPHIKTHKVPELARLQKAHGAIGITAAKVGEARIMAHGGIDNILLAYPIVSDAKAKSLVELAERARISISIDSPESAEVLSRAASATSHRLNVLVEIDVGFGRCGVQSPEAAVKLAQTIDQLPGLVFDGLMFYPGHMFVPAEAQNSLLQAVNNRVDETMDALRRSGLPINTVSGGSSPTAYRSHEFHHLTEIRPGMYPLNDRNLVEGGFATLPDCALSVLATVISTAVPGRAILDGGSKTFSSDRLLTGNNQGFGAVLEDSDAVFYGLSEEHGHLNIASSSRTYRLGERLRIVPNHVCTTINMHNHIYGVRNGEIELVWNVAARGCVQ
jgi:D-serine deaminase-like pyridoxal phosphate-dependent protein